MDRGYFQDYISEQRQQNDLQGLQHLLRTLVQQAKKAGKAEELAAACKLAMDVAFSPASVFDTDYTQCYYAVGNLLDAALKIEGNAGAKLQAFNSILQAYLHHRDDTHTRLAHTQQKPAHYCEKNMRARIDFLENDGDFWAICANLVVEFVGENKGAVGDCQSELAAVLQTVAGKVGKETAEKEMGNALKMYPALFEKLTTTPPPESIDAHMHTHTPKRTPTMTGERLLYTARKWTHKDWIYM